MSFVSILKQAFIETPAGQLRVIADEKFLYVLGFLGRNDVPRELERLQRVTGMSIVSGRSAPIESIEQELEQYFAGTLQDFKTPLRMVGTEFQKSVWGALLTIPFGQTWSYAQLAASLGKPSAFRAVAQANGANLLGIIIPCHRVINRNGNLGGYNGTVSRKAWLLEHEKINSLQSKKVNGTAYNEVNNRIS